MKKLISSQEAMALIKTGDTLMVGGFGLVGAPLTLIYALENAEHATDLTIISNNLGEPNRGLGKILRAGRVKKAIGSFFTSNPDVIEYFQKGLLETQLLPQGTLSEAIRAGGAGIGGFYTKSSAGTLLSENKEVREIDGELYVLEKPLHANVALIRAFRADSLGNLTYYKSTRNFNPMMATAADIVIAEVDELVETGDLNPEEIITPHVYVDYVVRSEIKLGGARVG